MAKQVRRRDDPTLHSLVLRPARPRAKSDDSGARCHAVRGAEREVVSRRENLSEIVCDQTCKMSCNCHLQLIFNYKLQSYLEF